MNRLETPRLAKPIVDIQVQSPLWNAEPAAQNIVRVAIAGAAARVPADGEVSVALADDAAMRALNHRWLSVDKSTNVLSFPAAPQIGAKPILLGDIVIAYETTAREALQENKPLLHHLAHLAVHGYLHLMGYDHRTDSEAEMMESLERAILANLGIVDPYLAAEPGLA